MASVATSLKRLFLRNLYWSVEENGDSLENALKEAAKAQFKEVSVGKILISTSANGHFYTWDIPSGITPNDIAELIEELLTRYDEANEYLVEEEDIESPTDRQIFNEMMRCLTAVSSVQFDFGGNRDGAEESD